ncbi:hypothetical protein Ahy_B08g091468 [Arachis hypogaea]|uniref:Ubiquitin-like protease family profile domain-containing protein n=1 Tax=Arachis hypogaea TaxID=3818 RepID=A0A444Y285_ARAHY|nr:hypothetical protein Ahy_B08g091468 [Arachis hypogaea]
MLGSHDVEYIDPNTKKAYQISEFMDYLPFLDKRKLASHSFTEIFYPFSKLWLFAPVCNGGHWWLWIADT